MFADKHCGHKAGLTPPRYQDSTEFKWGISQREAWKWYTDSIKKYGPFDVTFEVGDLIAGKNDKQGGTQLITTDRNQQVTMAMQTIEATKCKKVRMVYGTPYHAGREEDWELTLCKRLLDSGYDAKIDAEDFYDINGVVISLKHHMARSAQDSLMGTPLRKEALYNDQWVNIGIQQKADIIIRGHVHYFDHDESVNRHVISCPALCTLGDKFGARIVKGVVHFGFVTIDISKTGKINIEKHIETLASQPDKPEVL